MSTQTIFEQCSAQYNVGTELSSLIQCISDMNEEATTSGLNDLATGVNEFWLIYGGALVFFMQIGFAMLCAGCIRAKNVKNVILWNLLDSCGGGVSYWTVGYAFAFGGDNPGGHKTFIGHKGFFVRNENIDNAFWMFEWAFACALSSIVAGAIAERTKMSGYLLYSAFLCGWVYPVVSHAYWSANGFLSPAAANPLFGIGTIDLAGSGPVHMCGGVAALAGALVVGPRRGRFYDDDGNLLEKPKEFPPHSTVLIFLGTFCLWFGWYGFNPASTLRVTSATYGATAALAAANTTLAACTGALSALYLSTLWSMYTTGVAQWDCLYACNGCLCGLAAITAPCASVPTWAGVVIGAVAGLVYLLASKLMVYLRIDDAVDAVPVHLFGGMWGDIASGLFGRRDLIQRGFLTTSPHQGWFFNWGKGGDFHLLGAQLVGIIFNFTWTFVMMYGYFSLLKAAGLLRADPLEEEVGLDISRHKGVAYEFSEGSALPLDIEELNKSRSNKLVEKTFAEPTEKEDKEVETAGEINA